MDFQIHLQELQRLDDDSLLRSLKRHVGGSNRLNALVLAHLAEVDARGAYRQWACETLAAYCVYELRLSEDEAQRRCRAARVARKFPVLFEMLADGSIHLTGIVLLAPYLTMDNHREVLERARHRRKREIERLVAELAPMPEVPALIAPLSAAGSRVRVSRSDWAALAESSAGWVRQLVPGDGPTRAPSAPDDWHEALLSELEAEEPDAPARQEVGPHTPMATVAEHGIAANPTKASARYRVQFTADQAYVDLLEQARALLWHRLPSGDLAQLQRLALEALVEKLVVRKYGAGARSAMVEGRERSVETSRRHAAVPVVTATPPIDVSAGSISVVTETRRALAQRPETSRVIDTEAVTSTRPAAERSDATDSALARSRAPSASSCRNTSRHIPAAVRSAVWLRDEARCTFVDARGIRCRATSALELHHEQPFARGGPSTPENIRLRCRTHNELAAEQDFGRDVMLAKKRAPMSMGDDDG